MIFYGIGHSCPGRLEHVYLARPNVICKISCWPKRDSSVRVQKQCHDTLVSSGMYRFERFFMDISIVRGAAHSMNELNRRVDKRGTKAPRADLTVTRFPGGVTSPIRATAW